MVVPPSQRPISTALRTSISESIDWARTLLLMGADDIDAEVFQDSLSIIIKHRSDLDLVAEKIAPRLGRAKGASGNGNGNGSGG